MTQRKLIEVPLDKLHDHSQNAHTTSKRERRKIANNIRRTGRYPALTVRELTADSTDYPGEDGHFQILDGHQRRLIFVDLVEEGLDQFALILCNDWSPITDPESLIALATLNSWGDNVPRRRAELLHSIRKFTEIEDAAAILPESAREINDALKLLHRPVADIQKLIEKTEEPDLVTISFVIGGDQKAALARFTSAAQIFALYYGATLTNVNIEEGGDRGRIVVMTFNVQNSAKTIIDQSLKRASAGLTPGVKNKRGKSLEALAAAYLAMELEGETSVPIAKVEADRSAAPPEKPKRKRTRAKAAPAAA